MRRSLIIIFVLLVVGPLLLLAGLGVKWARLEQGRLQAQFRELLDGKLGDVDAALSESIQKNERGLEALVANGPLTVASLDEMPRSHPWMRQAFLLDGNGKIIHPNLQTPSAADLAFLDRTREIWVRGDLMRFKPAVNAYLQNTAVVPQQRTTPSTGNVYANEPEDSSGWYGWYWGSGLNLLYYHWLEDGRCFGVEIDRARMLADLIAQLPDTASENDRLGEGRIALVDSNGALLYQWGAYDRQADEKPVVARTLSPPVQSWHLEYYAPGRLYAAAGGGLAFSYVAGFSAVALALMGLAFYFYLESTRDMRLAAQRVSFVNQVSHELKTPLTNVRLYAELLQQHLDEDDEIAQKHLNIVVEECGRLSRLIGNVLTFGRSQRGALTIHPTPGRVGEIVQRVLDGYRPALARHGIEVEYKDDTTKQVMVAADVVEQILGNLLSNIEKYAGGGVATIKCGQSDGVTTITVADNGPGIPEAERENIFRPFYRLSSALNDGAAGTGIGLAIARDLARKHGGDIRLVEGRDGAVFEVTLETADCDPMQ